MDYSLDLPDQLAQHLRALRKARGLSQTALASKLGLTQSRVAAIERNPRLNIMLLMHPSFGG